MDTITLRTNVRVRQNYEERRNENQTLNNFLYTKAQEFIASTIAHQEYPNTPHNTMAKQQELNAANNHCRR